ncbi:MAG: hypothetical protein IPJ74_17360 [Saprospiraceae bacterium]|nr:hypothetical protein [Saprospiraceae bacterium]
MSAAEDSLKRGLRYSVVDFSSNPLGVVDASYMNQLLQMPVAEKLTAIQDANGSYWVIAHDFKDTTLSTIGHRFFAYHITSNVLPILNTPVISKVGSVYEQVGSGNANKYTMAQGQMKLSPDGKRLAVAVSSGGNRNYSFVELFDFDSSTGLISNPLRFNAPTPLGTPYGIEFSPNNNFLYISYNFAGEQQIQQIDLINPPMNGAALNTLPMGVKNLIINPSSINYSVGALQLAPME